MKNPWSVSRMLFAIILLIAEWFIGGARREENMKHKILLAAAISLAVLITLHYASAQDINAVYYGNGDPIRLSSNTPAELLDMNVHKCQMNFCSIEASGYVNVEDDQAVLKVWLEVEGGWNGSDVATDEEVTCRYIGSQSGALQTSFHTSMVKIFDDCKEYNIRLFGANVSGTGSLYVNHHGIAVSCYSGGNVNVLYPHPTPPSAGSLQFSSSTYSVDENAGSVTITVTRTGGSNGAVGVSYATSNGTATAGSDYTSASGDFDWADEDTSSRTFSIPILDDSIYEGTETVNLTLSNPVGGATLGSPSTAILTIVDSEPRPNTLTVTTPNGGESWPAGTIQTIRWTYTGSPGPSVKIELLKDERLNRNICTSCPIGSDGSGSNNWHIDSTQTVGSDYKIRVTSTSNATYTDTSNSSFTITTP